MDMPLRVLLADDEPLPRERLARLLSEAGCDVIGAFSHGQALLEALTEAGPVDAAFLDVRMPGPSGLELLAELGDQVPVVLVTAHPDYTLAAFEHAAFDYLLKPVTAERLSRTLSRLARKEPRVATPPPAAAGPAQRFPVRAGEGLVLLEMRRVTHFELRTGWVWAWTQGEAFRTAWTSLAEVEEACAGEPCCRIQRHILLRPALVQGLRPLWGRRIQVRVQGGLELEVSRSMTQRVKELLGVL